MARVEERVTSYLRFGFPRMRNEAGEKRDFLPPLVARLGRLGARVVLERGYGAGMGLHEEEYIRQPYSIRFADYEETLRQDVVMILRCPSEEAFRLMRPGTCVVSMLHYPTRPQRVAFLKALELEAVSLDSVRDDNGRRLIENLQAVAWNGVGAAFQALRRVYPEPGFENPRRPPVRVTLMGAGAVGGHVVRAAVRYGNEEWHRRLAQADVPGVQVTAVDYDYTSHEQLMREILRRTDILVDATQRPDPSRYIIPNEWVGELPGHAVILDLSVDPYDDTLAPAISVKAVEGIPQGNLDRYEFAPDDPAFDSLPAGVDTRHRRRVVSCYSWPGLYPKACMEVYGRQLQPVLRTVVERGGIAMVRADGKYFERATARAQLSRWINAEAGKRAAK